MSEESKADILIGLGRLREPFPANQISKLPKPNKRQTDEVKADYKKGIRCQICGGWHHPDVIHLDYVGHAALTDRLLEVDPMWNWKPLSFNEHGQPVYDSISGLWIELTVCGVTRLGYGNAAPKKGGDAIKEVIGDALRNAGMRFGMALDLWHKGELHVDDQEEAKTIKKVTKSSLTKVETVAIDKLFQFAESQDAAGVAETYNELTPAEAGNVWVKLPTDTQNYLTEILQ